MSDPHSFDESIPVLTEVVVEKAAQAAEPADTIEPADAAELEPPPALIALPVTHAPALPAPARALDDDTAWDTLEERLIARVLDRLQDRIALVLEDQVRSSMAPVLDGAIARLAAELHIGLQHTVERVVAQAVAQEVAHLKSLD
jgi:hypothetical protein